LSGEEKADVFGRIKGRINLTPRDKEALMRGLFTAGAGDV
jgi:hypothetical protein